MKCVLPAVLLALLSFSIASAQKIHFTDSGNQWKVLNDGGGTEYFEYVITYSYGSDTFFHGYTYKRLNQAVKKIVEYYPGSGPVNKSSVYFFREDTLLQRVYCFDRKDSTERIIYDGNWQVGDSIHITSSYPNKAVSYFIWAIDSTSVGGLWYKVFHFNKYKTLQKANDAYAVIEGLGSSSGPWMPASTIVSGGELSWGLRCFQNSGGAPEVSPAVDVRYFAYGPAFNNTTSCSSLLLGVARESPQEQKITIVPNPADGNATMRFSPPVSKGELLIYDACGRVVCDDIVNDEVAIAIGKKITVPGFYFYRLVDAQDHGIYYGRFTFQQ